MGDSHQNRPKKHGIWKLVIERKKLHYDKSGQFLYLNLYMGQIFPHQLMSNFQNGGKGRGQGVTRLLLTQIWFYYVLGYTDGIIKSQSEDPIK